MVVWLFSIRWILGFLALSGASLDAHDIYKDSDLFVLKWQYDPTVLYFLFLMLLYNRSIPSLAHRNLVKPWQQILFYTGCLINIIALLPPIDTLSDRLFFMHMIQHLMMTLVGVPLMMFGVPFFVILSGSTAGFKKKVFRPVVRLHFVFPVLGFFSKPLVALIVYQVFFLFWHIPFMYNLALFNDAIHLVEHACFAFAATMLWRNIIDPHPIRPSMPNPAKLLFLAIMMASNIALSAFLTFTPTVWYGYQGIPQPEWWTYGYLVDQQLGGLIMWVPGGMIHFVAMTICFFAWAHTEGTPDWTRSQPGDVT